MLLSGVGFVQPEKEQCLSRVVFGMVGGIHQVGTKLSGSIKQNVSYGPKPWS